MSQGKTILPHKCPKCETTAVECKLLNRNLLAFDINRNTINLTKKAIEFEYRFDRKWKLA